MKVVGGWLLPLVLAVALAGWTVATSDRASRTLGTVWPVVSLLEIIETVPEEVDGLASSLISGTARKLRNCGYRGISFYLGGPDGVPVDARFRDQPQVREVGVLHWSGLVVGIPPDRLWETYGEVQHNCNGVTVISPFFIGVQK